jgi:hypothetical protein
MTKEILPIRDLVKDKLGNYYAINEVTKDKITLVNAVTFYASSRILNTDFVEEVYRRYDDTVSVGQFFVDMLKKRIETITTSESDMKIHSLEELQNKYEVVVDNLYERNTNIKVK